jgi:hypothetical protein
VGLEMKLESEEVVNELLVLPFDMLWVVSFLFHFLGDRLGVNS